MQAKYSGPTWVSTIAGNDGFHDGTGGPEGTAEISTPEGLAADSQGNIYVADYLSSRVRKISPAGDVTTLAGNGTPGWADGTGGPNGTAEFNRPVGVAVDAQGHVFVADTRNYRIREIDPDGSTRTVAGDGTPGDRDGPANVAQFGYPTGVAVDTQGNVYVADGAVRKIDPAGNVSTVTATSGFSVSDGWSFGALEGVAVDADGTIYLTDSGNNRVLALDASGAVRTLVQSRDSCDFCPAEGSPVCCPSGIVVDAQRNVYVSDTYNNRILKVDPAGAVTTLAGDGRSGDKDGTAGTAEFFLPAGLAVDAHGNVYASDSHNNRIRKVDPHGNVTTFAGNGGGTGFAYQGGYQDGTGGLDGAAEFDMPQGIAADSRGDIYVADTFNNRIRMIDPCGNVTTVAGNGSQDGNGVGILKDGTGGSGGSASFAWPTALARDSQGNLYVADLAAASIRKIDIWENVTTVAGTGFLGYADGPGKAAAFSHPDGVAVDSLGDVFVADLGNNRIRRIDPSGNVTTFAGNGTGSGNTTCGTSGMTCCADGTGGPNGTAEFNFPTGVAVDAQDNVYVADSGNDIVRKIDRFGNVTTVGGNCRSGTRSANGEWMNHPQGLAVDGRGNIYVADGTRVWEIRADGSASVLAGNGTSGSIDGLGGANGTAEFSCAYGVAIDGKHHVDVVDWCHNRIRQIDIGP